MQEKIQQTTMKTSDHASIEAFLITILFFIPFSLCNDGSPIPSDKSQLQAWFQKNIQSISSRKSTIDPALVTAEANPQIIRVRKDGSGQFKTITDALKSIPTNNSRRVIVSIGPGQYNEKIKIDRQRKFITFAGQQQNNKPVLVYAGTGAKYGTFYSATLTVEAEYFSAVNIRFQNNSPRPKGGAKGQQAVAMRIGGDKASFYNCEFAGFQDTLCDDQGRHFYKDCYIEGTIDFIFGAGKSMYLNCVIHIVPGDGINYITAQGSDSKLTNTGYSFVHCKITGGKSGTGYLGRAWRTSPKVVFAYSFLSDTVNKLAWSNNGNKAYDKTVFYGEYQNQGPAADMSGRYKYTKKLDGASAKEFVDLGFLAASTWLLPPAKG